MGSVLLKLFSCFCVNAEKEAVHEVKRVFGRCETCKDPFSEITENNVESPSTFKKK